MVNAKELRAEADKAWAEYDKICQAFPANANKKGTAFKNAGRASRRAWKAEKEAKQ